ncbi:MAG TPA: acyl-CoA dehydrogenase family protein [Acidimicrobiia bacterium]|nr:acyl-CoA dehydrogenase family protein [Acidimicrobiia bacterium]
MDFALLPEHEELAGVARRVAAELAPGYVERDRAGAFPWETLKLLADSGLLAVHVPAEAGGQGAGELAAGLVCEELGKADYTTALMVIQAGTAGKMLWRLGSERVKAQWLPRVTTGDTTFGLALTEPGTGSDISALAATAKPVASASGDGFAIRGEKSSMSFSDSQVAFVLAKTEAGPALFVVPLDAPGVTVAPFDDMGSRPLGRAVVTFDDVVVPADAMLGTPGAGVKFALGSLASSKVLVCCVCLGVAEAALAEAVEWARERVPFGAPLATRQGIAFPAADLATQLEAARLLAQKALWKADRGDDFRREAAMAKAWIPRLASTVCHEAILTIGHVAYSREHPAQLRLRDVLATELGEGPANTQRMIVARDLFGVTPS